MRNRFFFFLLSFTFPPPPPSSFLLKNRFLYLHAKIILTSCDFSMYRHHTAFQDNNQGSDHYINMLPPGSWEVDCYLQLPHWMNGQKNSVFIDSKGISLILNVDLHQANRKKIFGGTGFFIKL